MLSEQIIQTLLQLAPKNELWQTPIKGLFVHQCDKPQHFESYIQEPSVCIVLQGERQICLGDECTVFSQPHFMFCPVNMPVTMQVQHANAEKPYLSVSMKLDLEEVSRLLLRLPSHYPTATNDHSFNQWHLEQGLSEAFERLLNLLKTPNDIDFLAPLYQQEIYYRLLQGKAGEKLRALLSFGSHTQRIAQATQWIQNHFADPLSVESLAAQCGMSVSGFHHHFKKITHLSPLQYQKSLRLTEARKQLQANPESIAAVAFAVGYESPSQFSREYSRYFGYSPRGELGG
ncbi:AraC family transcriptional regulator N-terminal domain-containing protein [Neisseria lisongii]|uniref:AraC family transcriptional regulator n=1 Tax=Neisseria lisongii TaxID=2912188 RepID=A0AAW5AC83_9NEIS|nr:AraC family transcriptional regulator [Neisseria lisongii]MCF7528675.1 AraC family transcriptional regulator [Neisseria lisongii]MCF7529533.1 AraC family transcriptional regulator [Neisseria lisongii]